MTQPDEHGTLTLDPDMLDRLYNLAGKALSKGGSPRTLPGIRFRRGAPHMLSPPFLPEDLEQATYSEMRRYVKYQMKTCRRLGENQHLDGGDRAIAADRADYLAETLGAHPLLDDLIRAIHESRSKVISPLLDKLSGDGFHRPC